MEKAEQRLEAVRTAITRAAKVAGRDPSKITLIAVSKMHEPDRIRPLLEVGHRDFGENRVQEAQRKWPALKEEFPDVRLHMVGRLQSNKAADAAGLFDCIHSVDRSSLVKELGKAAADHPTRTFLQVDIGEEEQKGGCPIGEIGALHSRMEEAGIAPTGLMCIPPAGTEAAPYFALLAKLAGEQGLADLSMGMSADYESAVMLGATHVRVGTALFGDRPSP
ncbi:YggS family pyridoxal phosphate enzyme [Pacificimonas flava]|uniref:Pyridoxal phosphate homeostasis protein n=2 Tax=Pacificimonas TaxID=1960290 RepID=A0A219B329_9SPHN|nr:MULTISPECIES: YggS family pyridoxal phosphate-dependent enzyme [Pacificimonas]MBZ6377571.1 YggS family pyridoxal phosphate-dependent enzyme [Pacificimonas aurantium]OWV32737.1 YggS family pyridoxal phosphate enzyme [Pacificimonas flava]